MHDADYLRFYAGMTVEEACDFLGRSVRTWRHWKQHGFPDWVVRVMRLRAGYLDDLGWPGWQIDNGHLFMPGQDRNGFSPGDIYAAWWRSKQVASYQRKDRDASAASAHQGDIPSTEPVPIRRVRRAD